MMVIIRRIFPLVVALLLIVTLLFPSSAAAQDDIVIDDLLIQLWPEFDQPSMLVLYSGSVVGAEGEVELTFTIPEGAQVNAVAYTDASNALLTATSTTEGNQVIMTSPNGTFHVEFYDPALDTSTEQRSYTFVWPGDYAVNTLDWSFQVPPGSTDLTFDPPLNLPLPGQFGLDYYNSTQTGLAAGEEASFTVNYLKPGDTLTTDQLQPQEEAPADSPTTGETSEAAGGIDENTILITVLVIVGIGLLGGGLYLYNRNRGDEDDEEEESLPRGAARRQAKYRQQDRRRSDKLARQEDRLAARTGSAPARMQGTGKFCTRCGAEIMDANDRFCRNCGAPLQ